MSTFTGALRKQSLDASSKVEAAETAAPNIHSAAERKTRSPECKPRRDARATGRGELNIRPLLARLGFPFPFSHSRLTTVTLGSRA